MVRVIPGSYLAKIWQRARTQLLVKEKAATRARDALAAERRQLPMVRIERNYVFEGPDGKVDPAAKLEQCLDDPGSMVRTDPPS